MGSVVGGLPLAGQCRQLVKELLFRTFGTVRRLRREAGKAVLLTFDDGPDPRFTPAVLDRLRAFDARAVFCCIGERVRQWPDLVRRARMEGHRIGNHTDAHCRSSWLKVATYAGQVQRCQDAIATATG